VVIYIISKDVLTVVHSWEGRCVGATLIAVNGRVRAAAQGGKMRGSHTV
jgi:hypothetical protein